MVESMRNDLTPPILEAALEGLEAQKRHIESFIALVRTELGQSRNGHSTGSATAQAPVHKPRQFSAQTRKRMAEAQRKR
jgi:hypothetical protein